MNTSMNTYIYALRVAYQKNQNLSIQVKLLHCKPFLTNFINFARPWFNQTLIAITKNSRVKYVFAYSSLCIQAVKALCASSIRTNKLIYFYWVLATKTLMSSAGPPSILTQNLKCHQQFTITLCWRWNVSRTQFYLFFIQFVDTGG